MCRTWVFRVAGCIDLLDLCSCRIYKLLDITSLWIYRVTGYKMLPII